MRLTLSYLLAVSGILITSDAWSIEPPTMREITSNSGISHQYTGGWEYFVGGGVAAFDCNNDRYPELYFAGGAGKAALYLNYSKKQARPEFIELKNSPLSLESVTGAYPLDIDNDGILDLAVLRLGENILFRGTGDCQFEHANSLWGFDGGSAWTTAFTATWEDENQYPTLAFGNYVDRSLPGSPFGTCHDNSLFRFTDGSHYSRTLLSPGFCSLSVLFSDWNRSGHASLRITNDRQYYRGGYDQLWNLQSGKNPSEYTSDDGWRKLKVWGMGLASAELTGDGRPEYYITSMADQKLRTLASRSDSPEFKDIAFERGVTAHRPFTGGSVLPSTGWHAQFDDVNNDSFIDLFVVKGNVEAMTDFAMKDPNNLFLGSPSGVFTESAEQSGLLSFHRGRGGSLVDLNLDGLLDVVVVNREHNAQIWQNLGQAYNDKITSPMGNWIALELLQDGNNRHAVGSWVEVRIADRTESREVTIGGGHAGGKAGWHHFGIGVAERAKVRVQWPNGEWGPWIRVFANQFVRISKGKSIADVWVPGNSAGN